MKMDNTRERGRSTRSQIFRVAVLCLILILTVAFHYMDALKFLENLGFAVIVILTVLEALRALEEKIGEWG